MVTAEDVQDQPLDEIDQDQQALDQEQGAESAEPTYVTREELAALRAENTQLTKALTSQIAGVQGLQSKALNAIRSDTQKWAEKQIESVRQEALQKTLMDKLPEEFEALKPILNEVLAQRQVQPEAMPPTQPVVGATEAEERAAFAQTYGIVNYNDPYLRWEELYNEAVPLAQRQQAFMNRAFAVRMKELAGANPQVQSTPQAKAQSKKGASPPIEGAPSNGGNLSGLEGIRDAIIQGRISPSQGQEEAMKHGWRL